MHVHMKRPQTLNDAELIAEAVDSVLYSSVVSNNITATNNRSRKQAKRSIKQDRKSLSMYY